MLVRAGYEIDLCCETEVPLLMALSTHSSFSARMIGEDHVRSDGNESLTEYVDGFGNRITRYTCPRGNIRLWSDFIVEVDRSPDPQNWNARQHEIADLPNDVLTYLLPSRYCDSDALASAAWSLFGATPMGWGRVQAICDFVHNHVTFGYQFGRADKTASEVYREKAGVCRDFAHLSIAFCRAMNIPARYASGYLGDIDVPSSGPGDFCAWFEVFLDGAWHTFDARYNVPRIGRVLMVRGPDAAQVAMITSFGSYKLVSFRVWCDEVMGASSDADLHRMLEIRPEAEALVYPSTADAA